MVTIRAYDPDGDSISYHLDRYPPNTTIVDSVITFTPSYVQAGIDTIIYSVREHPSLLSVSDTFQVLILDAGVIGSYTDRSAASGLADPGVGNAAAWIDYDGDGYTDVFVANGGGVGKLYRGGAGAVFSLSQALPAGTGGEDAVTAAWADFDHDGRPDLYVGNAGPFGGSANRLYRQDSTGSLIDITAASGTGGNDLTKSVTWVDFDRDGVPDIHVVNYGSRDRLYHHHRHGVFVARADSAGIADAGDGVAGVWCDFNNDFRPDLYLVRENGPNRLFRNNGDSTFTDVSASAGVAHAGQGAAAAWGDFDNDGYIDLFLANKDSVQVLYSNNGNGTFTRMPNSGLSARGVARSALWIDFDLDGHLDLVVTFSDSSNKLYRNNGDSTFSNIAGQIGLDSLGYWTSVTWADPKGAGEPNLYLTRRDGTNRYLDGIVQGHWLKVKLHGVVSNRFGLGARVRVRTGSRVQTRWIDGGSLGQSEPAALFGLGNAAVVDSLTVFWPSGLRRDTTAVAINQALTWFETDSLFPAVDSTTRLPDTTLLAGPYTVTTRVVDNNAVTATLFYSTNRGQSYTPAAMSSIGSDKYSGNIPGQPSGTRVRYYVRAIDSFGHRTFDPPTAPDSVFSFSADSTRPVISMVSMLPDTSDTAGPYTLNARARDNDSLRAVYMVRILTRGGAVISRDSLAMSISGSDTAGFDFSAAIPGQPLGTRVDYYVRAVDLARNTSLRPATAPDSNLSFRVAEFSPRNPASVTIRRQGSGVAVADYNRDGIMDIFLANLDSTDILLRGRADSVFQTVTTAGVSGTIRASTGGWWGDYNNDGYPDLYVTVLGTNVLFSNNRNGTFTDITSGAGVGDPGRSWGAAWVDYDNDGLPDLFVVDEDGPDKLYRNNGDSTFTDMAVTAGTAGAAGSVGCAWCDFDRDGYRDLYVVYYGSANRLYRNNGDGTFSDVTAASGTAAGPGSVSAAWFDYDNDGFPDLYVVEQAGDRLYRNNGNGTFSQVSLTALGFGSTPDGFTATWGDFDNDSRADLFKSRGETGIADTDLLMRGLADGTFSDYSGEAGFLDFGEHRGAAWIDYDRDGRQDLVVNKRAGQVLLYRNQNNSGNNYLRLRLTGTRSNADALGAQVTAWFGGKTRYRELGTGDSYSGVSEPVVHLGLGSSPIVDSLAVRWPLGLEQRLYGIQANLTLDIVEADSLFPSIVRFDTIPNQYVRGVKTIVTCEVQDRDPWTTVLLRYRTGAGGAFLTRTMNLDSTVTVVGGAKGFWRDSLPEFSVGTTVYWRLVTLSLRGTADSTDLFSYSVQTDSTTPEITFIVRPDSLHPDTLNPVRFVVRLRDDAGVNSASFRLLGTLYPSGAEVSLNRDTVFQGAPRAVDWEINAGPYSLGSRLSWLAACTDVSGLTEISGTTAFRIAPRLGKSRLHDGPVKVADIMRLVYLILDFVPAPTLVDSLGLDLNRNGWFDDSDLDAILALWRAGVTLAGADGQGQEPEIVLDAGPGWVSFKLLNREPVPFVLVELETEPVGFRGVRAVPGPGAAELSLTAGPYPGGGLLVLLTPSGEDQLVRAGQGELFRLVLDEELPAAVTFRVKRAFFGTTGSTDGQKIAVQGNSAAALPRAFTLEQNQPNPFNPSTTIRFAVPEGVASRSVRIDIYNIRGALVRTILDRELPAGFHSVEWDGSDSRGRMLPSGVYFCRLLSEQTSVTRKMILLK